jgi:hypothetical protein
VQPQTGPRVRNSPIGGRAPPGNEEHCYVWKTDACRQGRGDRSGPDSGYNSAPTRTASATTEESGDFTVHLDVSNVAPGTYEYMVEYAGDEKHGSSLLTRSISLNHTSADVAGNTAPTEGVSSAAEPNTNSIICDGSREPETTNGCPVLHRMRGPSAVRHSCATLNPDQPNARSPERALRSRVFFLTLTGSKIAFVMPDLLEVRLDSQGF